MYTPGVLLVCTPGAPVDSTVRTYYSGRAENSLLSVQSISLLFGLFFLATARKIAYFFRAYFAQNSATKFCLCLVADLFLLPLWQKM